MRIGLAVAAIVCLIPFVGCTPDKPAEKTNGKPEGKPAANAPNEKPADTSAPTTPSSDQGAATGDTVVEESVTILAEGNSEAKQKAADRLASLGPDGKAGAGALATALGDADVEVQWRAARALGAMGPAAAEAVDPLIKALKSENAMVRGHAAHALGQIGPASKSAADQLASLLADPESHVRRAAVKSLLALQLPPEQLIKFMLQALESQNMDPSVTVPALEALAQSGDAGVQALIKALNNDNARYWACIALASVGPNAKAAVPELVKLTTHSEPEVRMQSVMAIGEIGPDAKTAVPALIKALDDQEHSVRYGAALALAKIGDASAVEGLEKQLASDDRFLKMISAWAIAKLQPDNTASVDRAIELLSEGLKDSDPSLRAASARGLLELNLPREKAAPVLLALMEEKDPIVRANVVDGLASLGELAFPKLRDALKNDDVQSLAVAVIRQMGPKAKEIIGDLALELKDDDPQHRREAAFALAAIGPDAKDATPFLIEVLTNDEEPSVRHAAIYAIGKIGPDAAAAKDALSKNMESDDKFTKMASVWALLQIQPTDKAIHVVALPLLIGAVENAEIDRVRYEAAAALGNIGAAALPAVPVLEKAAANDDSSMVREAAKEAIEKIKKGS